MGQKKMLLITIIVLSSPGLPVLIQSTSKYKLDT